MKDEKEEDEVVMLLEKLNNNESSETVRQYIEAMPKYLIADCPHLSAWPKEKVFCLFKIEEEIREVLNTLINEPIVIGKPNNIVGSLNKLKTKLEVILNIPDSEKLEGEKWSRCGLELYADNQIFGLYYPYSYIEELHRCIGHFLYENNINFIPHILVYIDRIINFHLSLLDFTRIHCQTVFSGREHPVVARSVRIIKYPKI